MIRIEIDRDRCVGSGNCVFWAPGTFDIDDEGLSVVIDATGDAEDRIVVAAEGCPSKAISVELVRGTAENPTGGSTAENAEE
jgi:ferredoxin